MQQEPINPIRHGALGTASGVAVGAGVGGVKSAVKAVLGTTALFVVAGAAIGFMVGTGGAGGIALGAWLGPLLGGAAGGLLSIPASMVTGGVASWFGAAKGGTHAANRINAEKGAANMLDAQLQAYQAQAYAAQAQPTVVYAPSAANNNYPSMNQAGSRVQADSAEHLGTINGMQLARA